MTKEVRYLGKDNVEGRILVLVTIRRSIFDLTVLFGTKVPVTSTAYRSLDDKFVDFTGKEADPEIHDLIIEKLNAIGVR